MVAQVLRVRFRLRGQDRAVSGSLAAEDRALPSGLRGPIGSGRSPVPPYCDAEGEMANAGESHEGDGDMGADPVPRPGPDRPHPEIVPGDGEALFRLPQAVIAGLHLSGVHVTQVGGHAEGPVPPLRLADHRPGIALHGEEAPPCPGSRSAPRDCGYARTCAAAAPPPCGSRACPGAPGPDTRQRSTSSPVAPVSWPATRRSPAAGRRRRATINRTFSGKQDDTLDGVGLRTFRLSIVAEWA